MGTARHHLVAAVLIWGATGGLLPNPARAEARGAPWPSAQALAGTWRVAATGDLVFPADAWHLRIG